MFSIQYSRVRRMHINYHYSPEIKFLCILKRGVQDSKSKGIYKFALACLVAVYILQFSLQRGDQEDTNNICVRALFTLRFFFFNSIFYIIFKQASKLYKLYQILPQSTAYECFTLTFLPLSSRTLGGVPTQAPSPLEATSSSQIICPDGVTSANFYPETWVYMHPSQDFIQVLVSAEDKSYRIIYNLFHKTVPEFKYRILQILRVQNQFLWEKYKR